MMGTVYFGVPIHRALNPATAVAIENVLRATPAGERVVWEPYWGDALIDRARSLQASRFLDTYPDADVFVTVDDDIVFEIDHFWKIVAGARATRSVFGGAYVSKQDTPHWTSREWPLGPKIRIQEGPSNPVHVEYVATGFMAVHRSVFEEMRDRDFEDANGTYRIRQAVRGGGVGTTMWPFFETNTVEEAPGVFHWLSEDWAFCERVNQMGRKCWIDQSIRLEHTGSRTYSVDDMETVQPGAGPEFGMVNVDIPITGDPIIDEIPAHLAEYTGHPVEVVWASLPHGIAVVAHAWNEWTGTEEDFYQNASAGAAYALDLGWWHLQGGGVPLEKATLLKGLKVLDYGAGIGTFALAAARAGAHVAVWEPNPWLREFIAFRAKKYGLGSIVLLTAPPARKEPDLDVVVCWHVFEHVADAVATLEEILAMLKPDGELIQDADFDRHEHEGVESHPMHHTFDGDWNEYVAARMIRHKLVLAGSL